MHGYFHAIIGTLAIPVSIRVIAQPWSPAPYAADLQFVATSGELNSESGNHHPLHDQPDHPQSISLDRTFLAIS